MAKNLWQTKNSNVTHACIVPVGTKSGDVLRLGEYLTAWAITDRATTDTINNGTAAQNLQDGEATCELAGVGTVVVLTVKDSGAQYAGVNRAADGTYGVASGDLIGVALTDFADGDSVPVALRSF